MMRKVISSVQGADVGGFIRHLVPPSRFWPARSFAGLLCAFVVGCSIPEPRTDLGFLDGTYLTDPGLHVFPDRHWRYEEGRGLVFRDTAALLVWIEANPPETLTARLTTEGPTGAFHFAVSWDEAPLWRQPVVAGEVLTVEINTTGLGPGLHRLTLERTEDLDAADHRNTTDNSFARIDLEEHRGGRSAPVPLRSNTFVSSFLQFGVTGLTEYRLGGCLFDGPQKLISRLVLDRDSEASFTVENSSSEPAIFKVEYGDDVPLEFEVEARGRRQVRFDAAVGDHGLKLEVAGAEDGAFLWGAPFLQPRGPAGEGPPPVVIVTLDTTRRDAVSPYSGQPTITPNLAAFAAEATVFSNAWAVAPWTLPSHASMFTGLYPSHHGAGVSDEVLRDDLVTLAEIFRGHGYVTGGFIGGHMSSSVFGLAQGFSFFHEPKGWERRGDELTDSAVDFITSHARAPLFMFINYFDPHEPYEAPAAFQEVAGVDARRRAAGPVPVWGDFARGDADAWGKVRAGRAAENPRGLAFLRSIYLAEVAFMDAQLGRVFETLRDVGIYDEALIVIVADHGELLGERGRYSHSYSLDPELTWVPLLIKWPTQRRREDVEALVSHVDLFSTIAAAADFAAPAGDGRIFGRRSLSIIEERELVMMEEHASRIHPLSGRLWISDHLFGLQQRYQREVLFDGTVSCGELREQRWTQTACRATWEERFALLSAAMRASAQLDDDHRAEELDPREAEKLRALGYIE